MRINTIKMYKKILSIALSLVNTEAVKIDMKDLASHANHVNRHISYLHDGLRDCEIENMGVEDDPCMDLRIEV